MAGEGHAVEGRHIFALRAGRDDDELVVGDLLDLRDVDERACRDLQIAELRGDLQDVFHAAAGHGDLAAEFLRRGDQALQPEGIRGEGRDDDALVAAGELALKIGRDGLFRRRIALPLDVRRVAQQRQHTFFAERAEAGQIDHAVFRGGVDLEVARHDDGADRRFDGERNGVGDGMVHVDELHGEAAGLDLLPCFMGKQVDGILQLMLLELQLDDAGGQARGVDGAVELLHGVRDAADMVLMPVGQEHAADLVFVFDQVRHVGNDQVDAVHFLIREAKAAVDDDDILAVFKYGHILADLVETAKGNDL